MTNPKYEKAVYRFGEILDMKFHDATPYNKDGWSYLMKKAGKNYAFWYPESELIRLEEELNNA